MIEVVKLNDVYCLRMVVGCIIVAVEVVIVAAVATDAAELV